MPFFLEAQISPKNLALLFLHLGLGWDGGRCAKLGLFPGPDRGLIATLMAGMMLDVDIEELFVSIIMIHNEAQQNKKSKMRDLGTGWLLNLHQTWRISLIYRRYLCGTKLICAYLRSGRSGTYLF
ncbi:hypothetical protein ACJX0J_034448 [Zea mays]